MAETLDPDTATHCMLCKRPFAAMDEPERFSRHARQGDEWVCTEVACWGCVTRNSLAEYEKTGELRSRLMRDAYAAVSRLDGGPAGLERTRPHYAFLYESHADTWRKIHADENAVCHAGRLAEYAVWFGRPDLATDTEVAKGRVAAQEWPVTYRVEPGPGALKTYYRESPSAMHSCACPDVRFLLGGSAGRVLLTIEDAFPQGDPQSRHGGAKLTLIFDETADHPRGGVQSLAGTRAELLGLLDALRSRPLVFAPDDGVRIG